MSDIQFKGTEHAQKQETKNHEEERKKTTNPKEKEINQRISKQIKTMTK